MTARILTRSPRRVSTSRSRACRTARFVYQRAGEDPDPDDSYIYFEDLAQVARDDTTTVLFDCNAWLEGLLPGVGCSGNTVWHDPATGYLLLTEYSAETTVELDATTFEPLRWFGLGYVPGGWTFDPPESAMVYPHHTHYTEAGTLLVSDFNERSNLERVLVREYAVDFATETLTEIFVTVAPPEVFGIGFGAGRPPPTGTPSRTVDWRGSARSPPRTSSCGTCPGPIDVRLHAPGPVDAARGPLPAGARPAVRASARVWGSVRSNVRTACSHVQRGAPGLSAELRTERDGREVQPVPGEPSPGRVVVVLSPPPR